MYASLQRRRPRSKRAVRPFCECMRVVLKIPLAIGVRFRAAQTNNQLSFVIAVVSLATRRSAYTDRQPKRKRDLNGTSTRVCLADVCRNDVRCEGGDDDM